tara:strand:- start:1783 stop:2163 length:381 start_codon:yes stop_codon:yes gene_type:complete
MASTHYVGQTPSINELLGDGQPRYFYALRRTEDGTLFFAKIDQLKDVDTITINNPGAASGDLTEFEYGVDFFDGRLESDHSRPFENLQWDQYRWDNKNMYYYVNDQGELVVRINQSYAYDATQIVT